MAFETIKRNIKEVIDLLNVYVQSNITYYKLKLIKQVTKAGGRYFRMLILLAFVPLVLFFFSIAGAIFIGNYLNNYVLGFVTMGVVLLLLLFIVLIVGSIIYRRVTIKKLVKRLFKEKE